MDSFSKLIAIFLVFLCTLKRIASVELTFELPDNSKECFYQDVSWGHNFPLIFPKHIFPCFSGSEKSISHTRVPGHHRRTVWCWWVVFPGDWIDHKLYKLNVCFFRWNFTDVELMGPQKEILYRQIKTQFDSHQFNAAVSIWNFEFFDFLEFRDWEGFPSNLAGKFLEIKIWSQ